MHQALQGEGRAIPLYTLFILFAILCCSVFFAPQEAHANVVYSSGFVGENMVFSPSGYPVAGEAQAYISVDMQNANSVFPYATNTPVFYTISTTTDRMRVKRVSGSTCTDLLANHVYVSDGNGNGRIGDSYVNAVEDHVPYCDLILNQPVASGSIAVLFATYAGVVLDGSTKNPGAMYDGYNEKVSPGGPAFQLCNGTCDESFPTTTAPVVATTTATSTTATSTCTTNCYDNVLFLPGIESSRLYRPDYNGGTDKLWEPNANSDVEDLFLTRAGTGIRSDVYAKEHDVLDVLPDGAGIYKTFIEKMDALKSTGTIHDWEPIAYDWRLSLEELLVNGHNINGRIYYTGDQAGTSTPYIIQELHRLASTSKTGKVTIVAHSNGGLLAKRLTEVLGDEAPSIIDRIILVAVPQVGTPMAIAAGMHGYDQEIVQGAIMTKRNARTFASTSPMFYNLLPSAAYLSSVIDPLITFDTTIPDWNTLYNNGIKTKPLLDSFLTDSFGRVDSHSLDLDQPIQFDTYLLAQATNLHSHLDTWIPPQGVDVVQIAGWGVPSTLAGIAYKDALIGYGSRIVPNPVTTVDGDGTVVTPSALWTSSTSTKNYWVNLEKYNKNHPFAAGFGFVKYDHSRILAVVETNDFIADIISENQKPIANYQYLSVERPVSSEPILRYTLHSPLTLNLYDDLGNHTGVSTTTGEVDEQIPGTYYSEIGDTKYVFSTASSTSHIILKGYDTGKFTLNIDQLLGDTVTASTTFKNLPTTPETVARLDVQSDITTLSPLRLDRNGDGVIDANLTPKLGGIVTLDNTAPTTSVAVHGVQGLNGWYTSIVDVVLSATDTESGVHATYVSLDGEATTTTAHIVIGTEGIHVLRYYSDDNAGNTETIQSFAIKIDITAPDAKLAFDTVSKTLKISGSDTISSTSVVTTATTTRISDMAGHVLSLSLIPVKSKSGKIIFKVTALNIDGVSRIVPTTTLTYKWRLNQEGTYTLLASYLTTGTSTIESHYRPKKNTTVLMLYPIDLDDLDSDDTVDVRSIRIKAPGMVLPYMVISNGKVTTSF